MNILNVLSYVRTKLAALFSRITGKAPATRSAASCAEVATDVLPAAQEPVAELPAALVDVLEGQPILNTPETTIRVSPTASRSVDVAAALRDIDFVFPQLAVKPTSTMEEIQFNAGVRHLADWMRQQYLDRGRTAGTIAKGAHARGPVQV